jgi:hypothetical protein
MHFLSDCRVSSVLKYPKHSLRSRGSLSSCMFIYTPVFRAVLSRTHKKITIFSSTLIIVEKLAS